MRQLGCVIAVATLGLTGCVERIIELGQDSASGSDGKGEDEDEAESTGPGFETEAPACFGPEDCGEDQTCFEGVCVGTGELRVSLSWEYVSDLDLHVVTPSGAHIHFSNPRDDGGELDVDDCVGSCVNPNGVHVENIFFAQTPATGEYEVYVVNYDGRRAGPFRVEVTGAATALFEGEMPAAAVRSDVFRFTVAP